MSDTKAAPDGSDDVDMAIDHKNDSFSHSTMCRSFRDTQDIAQMSLVDDQPPVSPRPSNDGFEPMAIPALPKPLNLVARSSVVAIDDSWSKEQYSQPEGLSSMSPRSKLHALRKDFYNRYSAQLPPVARTRLARFIGARSTDVTAGNSIFDMASEGEKIKLKINAANLTREIQESLGIALVQRSEDGCQMVHLVDGADNNHETFNLFNGDFEPGSAEHDIQQWLRKKEEDVKAEEVEQHDTRSMSEVALDWQRNYQAKRAANATAALYQAMGREEQMSAADTAASILEDYNQVQAYLKRHNLTLDESDNGPELTSAECTTLMRTLVGMRTAEEFFRPPEEAESAPVSVGAPQPLTTQGEISAAQRNINANPPQQADKRSHGVQWRIL